MIKLKFSSAIFFSSITNLMCTTVNPFLSMYVLQHFISDNLNCSQKFYYTNFCHVKLKIIRLGLC